MRNSDGHPLPTNGGQADPRATVRAQRTHLPKRFYRRVDVEMREGAYVLCLDGRAALTPASNPLALPTLAAAEAVVVEWASQIDVIDPATMPMTRISNSTIDGVAKDIRCVQGEIVKYSGSDLLCYRAAEPPQLVDQQAAIWDPLLAWAKDELGAALVCVCGIFPVSQPREAIDAIRKAVASFSDPLTVACLHVMTTLTGSVVLALAVGRGKVSAEEAWAAANVDEDHQMRIWGVDAEAMERQALRWREMEAAARLLTVARP